ncbi:DUF1501 domain-containing protein [Maricaulis sp.]|uniref:DUF1501 domain-containing protein n=1 Tax=Maricaulis sp. TaxID=1486257 RepID=UPI0025F5924A|nr:DUF1501 domain-containing protein [Maricaulis sp.]MDF1768037.1 DUF1501 domain-containing protein [Maricaulis sp.]
MTRFQPDRRELLAGAFATGALTLGGTSLAHARTANDRKLVVVILRGAMDGLAALIPAAEPRYRDLRQDLAISGGFDVGEGFRLHPRLTNLHRFWNDRELVLLPATATGYRERSHFDGQDYLEAGSQVIRDGWLNRALQVSANRPTSVGIGQTVPLILRGDAATTSWSPGILPDPSDGTIERLMDLYAGDSRLAETLAMAVETDAIADGMLMNDMGTGGGGPGQAYLQTARAAANLLAAPDGPGLAVISLDGWDTHVRQGSDDGQLANRLGALDAALAILRDGLQAQWSDTAVLVLTEFGRTVRANGSGGTDHGTAGTAFLLGGAVRGGRLIGDWPGLDTLHEDRDLVPANRTENLCRTVLAEHWGLDRRALDQRVFPGLGSSGFRGLIG